MLPVALVLALVLSGCFPSWLSDDPDADNMLTTNQQTFESGTDGWVATSSSRVGTVEDPVFDGDKAMAVSASTARSGAEVVAGASTLPGKAGVDVDPDAIYGGSIQVRAQRSGRQAACGLTWYDASGTVIASGTGPLVDTDQTSWTQARCAGRAPANAATVALRVQLLGGAPGEAGSVDEAWLSPLVADAPDPFVARINSGSSADLSLDGGQVYLADHGFVGGHHSGDTGAEIAGTDNDRLYSKHRWGMEGYTIPVPRPGTYEVRLYLAETVIYAKGKRVFDVSAEGELRLDDLDVYGEVGANRALVEEFDVEVDDGRLEIDFGREVEDPMVSGIKVAAKGTGSEGPVAPTPTTAAPAPTTTAPPPTTTTPPSTTTAPPPTTTAPAPTPPPPGPTSGAFPNASNTGPSGTLTPSGSITTSRDGQVIQNVDVNGEIRVQHNNVTIRNVRVRSQGGNAVYILHNTGLVVEDCELDGQGRNPEAAIALHNYTMRRCEVHGFGEGPRINGNNILEDNFIHDFANFIAQGAHQDCIQATSGTNVVIRHNTCLMNVDGGNGSIYFSTSDGSNILIEDNLLGGGNWAVAVDPQRYRNVTVRNNHITTAIWPNGGYIAPFNLGPDVVVSGNVWADGPRKGSPAT